MKTFKSGLLLLAAITFAFISHSQTKEPIKRELGLTLSSLNRFGFVYKKQVKENKFFRINAGELRYQDSFYNATSQGITTEENQRFLDFNMGFGWENRRAITEDLNFSFGLAPSIFYNGTYISHSISGFTRNYHTISPSIGYRLGFNLELSEKLGLNVETTPSLRAIFNIRRADQFIQNRRSLVFSPSLNFIFLTIAYRFEK